MNLKFCQRILKYITISLIITILCIASPTVFANINPPVNSQNLVKQGKILYDLGRYTESVEVLHKALNIYQSNGDNLRQAVVLSNLSLTYQQLGLWDTAKTAISNSLNLLGYPKKSTENITFLAQVLDIQGKLQFTQGQSEQALETWQKAENIYRQLNDSQALIRNQINSAQALQALGLFRKTNKLLTEVEESLRNQPDSLLKVSAMRNLGSVLQVSGNLNKSRQILEQTLVLAKSLSANAAIAETLFDLANYFRIQEDYTSALNYYQLLQNSQYPIIRCQSLLNQFSLLMQIQRNEQALKLISPIQAAIDSLPLGRVAIDTKINFARNLIKYNHSSSSFASIALTTLKNAILESQKLQDKRIISYAIGTLAELYEKNRQFSDAQTLTQKALNIAQSINAPDIAYQWQWQLGRILKDQGNTKLAILFYTEAVKTLELLWGDLVAINQDVQLSFRESVEPVYRELVALLLQPKLKSQANLQQARDTIELLQIAELKNYFHSDCLEPKQNIDLIVDKKDSNAAIIYPIISSQLDIILKLPNQPLTHHQINISPTQLNQTIAQLREYLPDITRTQQIKKLSQELYNWLIAPLEENLAKSNIQTIVFVLDGELRNIPMAVLYNLNQQKYLIEKYAIATTPGLALIESKPFDVLEANTLIAGISEFRKIENIEFTALENVIKELTNIKFELNQSKKLLNNKFTETNLKSELESVPYSVVHLATHGEFSSDLEKSFILTWDKLLKVNELENILRTQDQLQTTNLELLVLSACKTAQSDKYAALGIAGISVRAGARSTLATLWSVDDESTTELMSEFYNQLKTTKSKTLALKNAQISLINKDNRPYKWAPFILVGNWL